MGNFAFEDLSDENEETEETILHELTRAGAFKEIWRMHQRAPGQFYHSLRIDDDEGELCTHLAAKLHRGSLSINIMSVLERIGADLNAKNKCAGDTVLHTAVRYANYKLVEWLCTQPLINLEADNYAGLTAYQLAYKNEDEQLMKMFHSAGANCEEPEETSSEESSDEESDE